MRISRFAATASDAAEVAADVRALTHAPASVETAVAETIARVRDDGDAALRELTMRFDTDGAEPLPLRVDPDRLQRALEDLDPEIRAGLEIAVANVRTVAEAGLHESRAVELPQGQRVLLREVPVAAAAIYVPGGRAPYPSTVVMGAVVARAAGVSRVVVCTPPGDDGDAHPTVLAACALCGVDEVLRVGGAQAIAALALGTETIDPVDVIVGPGNSYVQEAKRQLFGRVGIDSVAGPSELLVALAVDADPRPAALDLLAQAEHGADSLVAAVADDAGMLDALEGELRRQLADDTRSTVSDAACALVLADGLDGVLAFADALAPEHLQLIGAPLEARASDVRNAGCLFVGEAAGTAFGDYVAGSNHVLPTGGAARFSSVLGPAHFRRRMSEVQLGSGADALARAGAPIARAEGFVVHAESMEARIGENPSR